MVAITSDSLGALSRKVADEKLVSHVLSDPGVRVSRTYSANRYGMMGEGMNGHSFVLVGPDGTIRWRADYGGAPNYTMYVPVPVLLSHMQSALSSAGPK